MTDISDRIKHIVAEIETIFGHGHPLATQVVDEGVSTGKISVTDPNPEPGKVAETVTAPDGPNNIKEGGS